MLSDNLRKDILSLLENNKVGSLATVKDNKPHSRYMTFFNEGLTLYTPTTKDSYKAEEIEANPNVHILLGYTGDGMGDAYLEIQGTAQIIEDEKLKSEIWKDGMDKWIDGPDDPNYIVLKITPDTVRLMNNDEPPQTLNLENS
ncbi:pyridoxamine 5'-phosphate oxidase family protein [Bacillus massilinigeriensis]|uniref:pyridoxamine 5'-phosphate oxidase family protein n=1 Tax=Bacillus mediterraneensis TaxID=1805474 RepID=UPI001F34841F|nr:pyridoxamine 5'-phosphate oxidase family protein [Bacillus mediterraneensis]